MAASEDRSNGLRLPPRTGTPHSLDYRSISRFAPQLERYFQTFGRDAVKVILLEHLMSASESTLRAVHTFLGLDAQRLPEFRVYNEAPGKSRLERSARVVYSSPGIHQLAQRIVPYRPRRAFLTAVRRAQRPRVKRDSRDDDLRAACRADIEHLANIITRDLSNWM